MNDDDKLPPRMTRNDVPPMTAGVEIGGFYSIDKPNLVGVKVEVQHPQSEGQTATEELGMMGVGAISIPGQGGRIMMHTCHPDGSSLCSFFTAETFSAFVGCMIEAREMLGLIMQAAKAAEEGKTQ